MRNLMIILFCCLSFLQSCKKKIPITHVSGTVVNTGTKQPIKGILVVMQDGVRNNTGGLFPGSKNVGSGATQQITTGADGQFSFSFQGDAPIIWAEHEQYRFLNPNGAYEIYTLTAGKDYSNLLLTMDAYALFNPILKGHNCLESDSVLILGGGKGYIPRGKGGGGIIPSLVMALPSFQGLEKVY